MLSRYIIEEWDPEIGSANLKYESLDGVFLRGAWKTIENNYCVERLQNYEGLCAESNESCGAEIVFHCSQIEVSRF